LSQTLYQYIIKLASYFPKGIELNYYNQPFPYLEKVDLAPPFSKVDLAPPFSKVDLAPPFSKVDLAPPFSKVDF